MTADTKGSIILDLDLWAPYPYLVTNEGAMTLMLVQPLAS